MIITLNFIVFLVSVVLTSIPFFYSSVLIYGILVDVYELRRLTSVYPLFFFLTLPSKDLPSREPVKFTDSDSDMLEA